MISIRHFPRLALIVVLVLLSQVLNAADFGTKHDPQGPLGIRLDYALATQSNAQAEQAHNWVFSSHITFKGNVEDITDGQLVKMVADAYLEMEADILQYSPKIKGGKPLMQPGAMSIMATGMEILFSSSQKGTTAFINTVADSPVKEQLELCMATWKDAFPNTDKPDHKNSRKCGEIMAAHQYYQIHSEKLGSLSPLPRVTTVTRLRSGEMLVIPPCGSDREVRVYSPQECRKMFMNC
jgi:hypothetical protein